MPVITGQGLGAQGSARVPRVLSGTFSTCTSSSDGFVVEWFEASSRRPRELQASVLRETPAYIRRVGFSKLDNSHFDLFKPQFVELLVLHI